MIKEKGKIHYFIEQFPKVHTVVYAVFRETIFDFFDTLEVFGPQILTVVSVKLELIVKPFASCDEKKKKNTEVN